MTQIIAPKPKFDLEEYSSVRAEVSQRLRQGPGMGPRGMWQSFKLWWRIEREVSKELKRRHPPGGLYAA